MKKQGILNPHLSSVIASIGHTEILVLADPGLPIPTEVPVIDLSLTRNIPALMDVLKAVQEELVVESYIMANEMETESPDLFQRVSSHLSGMPGSLIPHEEFKKTVGKAKAVIRTGETTPYANIALVAGVNF